MKYLNSLFVFLVLSFVRPVVAQEQATVEKPEQSTVEKPEQSTAEKPEQSEEVKPIDRMVAVVRQEIRRLYQNQYSFTAEEFSKHFELTNEQVVELDKVVEEFADEMTKGITDQRLSQVIQRKIRNIDKVEFFRVNGKAYSVDPKVDPEGKTTQGNLHVSSAPSYLWLNGDTGGSSINSSTRIDLNADKRWRGVLGVSDEQILEFREVQLKDRTSRAVELAYLILADELMVSGNQEAALREWLNGQEGFSIIATLGAYQNSRAVIMGLKDELPDCMTEAQKKAFRDVRRRFKR